VDLLVELQQIPGPAGDEGPIADFVEAYCRRVPGTEVRRVGDVVLAARGKPRVAVFAHTDTVGFTLGYDRTLIPIGGPHVEGDEALREAGGPGRGRVRVKHRDDKPLWKLSGKDGKPGSRWVYADPLRVREKKGRVSGPYLDNRAGVWNALRTLERCEDLAAVFSVGEEHSGRGAMLAARLVYEELEITQALISDITWHTGSIKNGKGPAISFRDRSVPRQRFLERVLAAAEASGIPFQREVESGGGSDGSYLDRSPYPIDWVFIGAPQKRSHTPRELCCISDLRAMTDLYTALVPALSRD
jgi:putative aminopeptidase FrvX